MPYGTVKVDNITFTEGGVDRTITVSGLYASTSGNLTVTGTISGATVQATSGIITTVQTVTGIFGLGSAASPSITFSGDLDNGLYSPGANQVAISTNGTGRLFVDSLGRVGVGTASPARILDIVVTSALTFRVKNTDSTSATQAQFHNDSDNGLTIISYGSTYAAGSILNVGANGTAINVTQGLGINAGSTYQIQFGIGNTERMRIDSSGRVGIGTTSPTGTIGAGYNSLLTVNSSANTAIDIKDVNGNWFIGTTGGSLVAYSQTATAERARIDSSGRLLVGTSTALSTSANNKVQIAASSTSGVSTIQEIYSFNTGGGIASLNLHRSNSNTLGTNALVTSGQPVGAVSFAGADGSNFIPLARILGEVDGTAAVNDMPGRLVFSTTADGAASPSERMRLDSSGRVGIGTTPSAPLDIAVGGAGPARIQFSQGSDHPQIDLYRSNGAGGFTGFRVSNTNAITGELVFSAATSGTAIGSHTFTERARIDRAGRLLLGTSTSETAFPGNFEVVGPSWASVGVIYRYEAVAAGPSLVLGKSRSGVIGTKTIVQNNDVLGGVSFHGADGSTDIAGASITAAVDGTPGANDMPGRLLFSTTADGASSPTERMRITSDGKVGIGTSSPNRLLETSAASDNFIRVNVSSGAYKSGIEFANGSAVYAQLYFNNVSPYDLSLLQQYSTGSLILGTNNTERARIDSSGRLLVGTSTATSNIRLQQKLAIVDTGTGTVGGVSFTSYSGATSTSARSILDFQRSRGTTDGSLTAVGNGDMLGSIIFRGADGANFVDCAIITAEVDAVPGLNDMPGRLTFSVTADGGVNALEAMRINNQRELLIGTTTRTANGGVLQISNGITFPGTQSACSDPNTLDDYEEGTFTPTVIGSSTAGTATYTNQTGIYTKIGRQVHFNLYVNWTSGTGTGNLRIDGLPFLVANTTNNSWPVSFGIVDGLSLLANTTVTGYANQNTSYLLITYQVVGGGAYGLQAYDSAAHLLISGSYATA